LLFINSHLHRYTVALLPRTQWLGLLHLDTIRERNKPISPPEKPKEAPFFLPTTAGLDRNPVGLCTS
jgi:U3 small nucleolar RNA-associated protein 21